MKRREFFRLSAPMLSAPFVLNSTMASTFNSFDLFNALDCDTVRDRFLVIVQLKGANDGLNTIIRPEYDSDYNMQRSSVYIPPAQQLTITDPAYAGINLHPNLGKIRDLCESGSVNVVQSVGYPTMNRSHFAATDNWLTGGDGNNENLQEGFMGRYLEHTFKGYMGMPTPFMPDPLGIHLRSKSPSLGFHTMSQHLKAINLSVKDMNYYNFLSQFGTSSEEFENLNCSDNASYMQQLDIDSAQYGQQVLAKFNMGSNSSSVNYGTSELEIQLRTVARLVNGGCRTKIFLTEMTGFDTHGGQIARHADLMTELSEGIGNFMDDLAALGLQERCLTVTFSEFGRKFIDNNGAGTDHGTLAPMLVFGHPDKIEAGLTGPKLDVTTLDSQGAPVVTATNNVDYREVFISIMKQWLGANSNATDEAFSVYNGPGNEIDLIQPGANATPGQGTPLCYANEDTDYEHEFNIVVPIAGTGGGNEPLQEITACDYVDLKPGFLAATGRNVVVYPLNCPPDGVYPPCYVVPFSNETLAIFNPKNLDTDTDNAEILQYTRKETDGENVNLIEKFVDRERIKINVYPNPTSDYINVNFNLRAGEEKVRLEILDVSGKVVPVPIPALSQSDDRYEVQLNVSDLISGTYYLRYYSEKVSESFKFVKI